jgi:predicted acyltransferase
MFWIIGGERAAQALEPLGGGPVLSWITGQLKHVEWEGFHFFDAIFPLFLFLIGVSIVLSLDRLVAQSGRREALFRVVRRSVLLFGIGVFYYGGFSRAWPDVAVSGVLPRIALCYLAASTLYILLPRKSVPIAAAACLAGYWMLMTFTPFPDVSLKHGSTGKKGTQAEAREPSELLKDVTENTRGTFEEGRNLAHFMDFKYLPGKKRNLYYTNEGLLSTIPAVATTLFGIMAGWILTSARFSPKRKVVYLVAGGAAGVVLGLVWGLQFPLIKRIWTSSFCLVASGASAIGLGAFYLMIDVLRWRKWCAPFLWIGSNALTVYLAANLLDFEAIAARFVGGDIKALLDNRIANGVGGLAVAVVGLALPVLLVRFLYQRKIFIRL